MSPPQTSPSPSRRRWPWLVAAGVAAFLAVGGAVFWEDIQRTRLDPKQPYQVYEPPPAPDYATAGGWLLRPGVPDAPGPDDPKVDIFFVGPTTYDGGAHWNAPADDRAADRLFAEVMAPNYAGPFVRVGRLFAPRYRQASLYTQLTLREDAREARAFAYGDVSNAFRTYLERYNHGRPFIVVGVEQGGLLASRLLGEMMAGDPVTASRLVAAYLIDTPVLAGRPPAQPCRARGQVRCVAAWMQASEELDAQRRLLERALVWGGGGELIHLNGQPLLCFNPILGAVTDAPAPARLHLGAANATGLEWDARPAFLARQVSARCEGGLLRVGRPRSASLRGGGSWVERRREPGYNLFYADLENDAKVRATAFLMR